MSKRREGRETAVQLLFSSEFAGQDEHDVEAFFQLHSADKAVRRHAEELYRGVTQRRPDYLMDPAYAGLFDPHPLLGGNPPERQGARTLLR